MQLIKKYNETNLIVRIVIGLCVGVLLGLLIPGVPFISLFGSLFAAGYGDADGRSRLYHQCASGFL